MDRHPGAGVAGSAIHDGETFISAFRFPSLASELEGTIRIGIVSRLLARSVLAIPRPEQATRVGWVSGASMIIRREVVETAGLFDEHYFLYFEETDFCLQASRAGWTTYYVPETSVRHIGGMSHGLDFKEPMPWWWFASRRHYYLKNHGRLYLWAANALWVLGFSLWRLRRWLLRRPDPDPPHMLRDFLRYNFRPPRARHLGCE
jgi:hypothetical protein